MSEHKYPIKYNIEPGEFTKEDLENGGFGGADSILLMSVMGEFGKGPMSHLVLSLEGKTGFEIPPNRLFSLWCMMAHHISKLPGLDPNLKTITSEIFEMHRQAILSSKGKEQ
jgi:hypothetical protein